MKMVVASLTCIKEESGLGAIDEREEGRGHTAKTARDDEEIRTREKKGCSTDERHRGRGDGIFCPQPLHPEARGGTGGMSRTDEPGVGCRRSPVNDYLPRIRAPTQGLLAATAPEDGGGGEGASPNSGTGEPHVSRLNHTSTPSRT